MFIRFISLVLVVSVICSLCACSKKPDTNFDGTRFADTKHITVLVDSLTGFDSSYNVNTSKTAQYIHDEVLKDLNIDVTFIGSDQLNFENGVAPDITFTIHYNIITTYYRMDSVINIAPYLDQYKSDLTNLTGLLGEQNIYSCTDNKSEVWYLTAKEYLPNNRITFIRGDWLEKLNLEVPKTTEELHKCLIAFRDNKDKLLGDDKDKMIPFFIDNEPNRSAKPLLDSCLNTDADDYEFYLHGYNRATQKGYKYGLKILNDWYLEDLLPKDYQSINPGSKESYESIEKGYVGAFCSKCDYLYQNGDNAHINAFYKNCGEGAKYIPVNTFTDKNGKYNAWDEDYLYEGGNKICLPSTCKEPLACLMYLNWISDEKNINAVLSVNSKGSTDDPFDSERYLITYNGINPDLSDKDNAELARKTASEVNFLQRGIKCVRYWPTAFKYVINSVRDVEALYPGSVSRYDCTMISSKAGEFDKNYEEQFELLKSNGSYVLLIIRNDEWQKVMVQGELEAW